MTKIKTKNLVPTLISTLFTLCTFIVFPASATGIVASDIQKEDQVNTTKTERIEVLGSKPKSYFRKEMIKAEDSFYDLYNQLTTNNDFKAKCRKVLTTGSFIKNRECKPNFVNTMRSTTNAETLQDMSSATYDREMAFRIKTMQKKHLKEMATTIGNNPKLKELFISFQIKKQELMVLE